MKDVGFYVGNFILTIGKPIVVIHLERNNAARKFVGDAFILYPTVRDRKVEVQHQPFEYPFDEEQVDFRVGPLTKKFVFGRLYDRAIQLIDQVKYNIWQKQEVKDPQLQWETVLTESKPKVLLELHLNQFELKALETIRDRTRSSELKKFVTSILSVKRQPFENPYKSSEAL